ncbi:MAG: tail fiber domain-containing protein [Bacteroidota bacterium]
MKSLSSLLLISFALLISLGAYAQVPQGIGFQGIARDGSGLPYSLSTVTVGIRIKDASSVTVYEETHSVPTDQFGLFKITIGDGTIVSGTFAGINWAANNHKVQVVLNGSPLTELDFESVPYALLADKADMDLEEIANVNATGLAVGQGLSWDGTEWVPTNINSGIWSQNGTTGHYDLGRVGIGIDTPVTALHLRDTSNFLIGENLTGSGFKMIYYAQKGAFRVGYLNNPFGGYNYNKFWDYDSVGFYSFAAGQNSRAKGFGSFAFGSFGWADGSGSVAFFGQARGNNSYTFGGSSRGRGSFTVEGVADEEGGIAMYGYTGGRYGVSIGGGTTGLGASSSREDYAIAIGWNSDARGQASIALGPSDAYGYNAFSTGWVTEARGNYSSTFGYQTNSYPYASMALGRFNVITGDSASWVNSDPIFMIGDGTSNGNRSNSFIIQKNGQTAIGYNAPTGMLQVSSALGSLNNGGSLDATHSALLLGSTTSGMAFDANQIETIGSDLNLNFNSAFDVIMAMGGGSVAVGHNVPASKLDVQSNGWQQRLDNNDTGGDDWYIGSSASTWAAGGGKFLISPTGSSSAAEFTIEADGQVGIGTTAPSDRMQIDANAGEDALRVRVGGTTRLRVHDNGGVSIGSNNTPPVGGLRVLGFIEAVDEIYPSVDNSIDLGTPTRRWDNVWATNGIIQTSDRRLKTNILPLAYGLSAIMSMEPVSFSWKHDIKEQKIGLIAQEVQQILPEVVKDQGEEIPLGVNYAEIVPVLIKGMQEQQQLIEHQQTEIEALKQQMTEIKALLQQNK